METTTTTKTEPVRPFTVFDPASGLVVKSGKVTQKEVQAQKTSPEQRILWNVELPVGTPAMPKAVPLATLVASLLGRVNDLDARVRALENVK